MVAKHFLSPSSVGAWLLFAAACSPAGAEQAEMLQELQNAASVQLSARVEVVEIQASDASLTLDLPGELEGSRDVLLASALGGFVEDVRVDAGDEVSKGDTLVVVDRATYAAQVAQAEASLDQAKADLERAEGLGDLATASQLGGLATQVKVAEANLSLARTRLSRAVIRAPFTGVVGLVGVDPGEVAQPGSPVVRLVQLDPLKVSLSVSDRDVVALAEGLEARVSTASKGDIRRGLITHIAPVADVSTRSFLVEAEVPNPDHDLLPGMIAKVEVDRQLRSDVVVLPQHWLVTKLDGYGVFVLDGDVARWRAIALGDVVRGQVIVREGLAVGDKVIMTGQHDLIDGDTVLVARQGTCCTDGRANF